MENEDKHRVDNPQYIYAEPDSTITRLAKLLSDFLLELLDRLTNFAAVILGIHSRETRVSPRDLRRISHLEDRIEVVLNNLSSSEETRLDPKTREMLLERTKRTVDSRLKEMLDESIKSAFEKRYRLDGVESDFGDALDRLISEKKTTSVRAFINLIIGIAIAAVGVWLLVNYLDDVNLADARNNQSAILLSARFGTVLLVEIFAYFFLNLYRHGMQQEKFLQNEISNIYMKKAATRVHLMTAGNESYKELISTLANTERNFILGKNEKTLLLAETQALLDRDSQFLSFLQKNKMFDKK